MNAANLVLRFLLEISAIVLLASLAFSSEEDLAVRIAGAVGALAFVVLWGRYVAPKASRRLADPARLILELVLFGTAAFGYASSGSIGIAALFAGLVIVNEILLFTFQQRDR